MTIIINVYKEDKRDVLTTGTRNVEEIIGNNMLSWS